MVRSAGKSHSAALITADFMEHGAGSRVVVTVNISSLAEEMAQGYQQGFDAGMDNLARIGCHRSSKRGAVCAR